MKKILKKFKTWLEWKLRRCNNCGSFSIMKGHYTSGWNNLCNQASGDRGVICNDCIHVEFDESLEIRRAKNPTWIATIQ